MKPSAFNVVTAAVFAVVAGMMSPMPAHAADTCRPKALVIMLDGLRGDAVENLEMTNLQRLSPDYGVTFIFDRDDANARELAGIVSRDDAPDAIMWYIDRPDHAGHGFGYYPYAAEYHAALKVCDDEIGRVLDAIASRKTFAEEDWLLIVTSDHGGWERYHGQLTTQWGKASLRRPPRERPPCRRQVVNRTHWKPSAVNENDTSSYS